MDGPFCISDMTPVEARVEELDRLANAGVKDPALASLIHVIRQHASKLCVAAKNAASGDQKFTGALRSQNVCARILALECLRAAQSVAYVAERSGRDCYQGVAWTIAHGGECKAKTVLFVALCRAVGLKACPIWLTQTGASLNHVLALVWVDGPGSKPLWADASIRGAMLGESPYEAVPRLNAHSIVGMVSPAGKGGGGGHGGHGGGGFHGGGRGFGGRGFGFPFVWGGWNTYWPGWPAWWWCYYYPYLCQSAPNVGFYSFPAHVPIAPAGCACIKVPVKAWGSSAAPAAAPAVVRTPQSLYEAYRMAGSR